jgi:hypothetical protein
MVAMVFPMAKTNSVFRPLTIRAVGKHAMVPQALPKPMTWHLPGQERMF